MNATSLTATGTDSLAVTRLRLTGFRNYASLALDLEPITVVATGPNGAGKTNLLEAISFLAPGRGLRGARLSDIDSAIAGETHTLLKMLVGQLLQQWRPAKAQSRSAPAGPPEKNAGRCASPTNRTRAKRRSRML